MSKPIKPLLAGAATALVLALVCVLVYARMAVPNAKAELPTRAEELARPDSLERKRNDFRATENPYGEYTLSFELSGMRYDTDIYHFEGNAIQMMALCYRSGSDADGGASEYFSAELHRMELGVIDVLVETTTLKRAGGTFFEWRNLTPGDYYLRFTKTDATQTVCSDYVSLSGYMEFAPEDAR